MTLAQVLIDQTQRTREWTLRLIADLEGDDWTFQPAPGLGHALWHCGHMAVSQDVLVHARCLGKSQINSAFAAHFPMGGAIASAREHAYPPVDVVLATMHDMQRRTIDAISGMSETFLSEPAHGKDGQPHPHYADKLGAITHCFRHEAFHAGQIALLRRMLGKAFLR